MTCFGHFAGAARTTLIHSTSSLNGPGFVSPSRKPSALTSVGLTGPAFSTGLPNEVASNWSSGTLTSSHSPFFVGTVARYEKATNGLLTYRFSAYFPQRESRRVAINLKSPPGLITMPTSGFSSG